MFVLVLGWLAQHHKGWVVLATGTALTAAGIAIFLAGFTAHQPLISRGRRPDHRPGRRLRRTRGPRPAFPGAREPGPRSPRPEPARRLAGQPPAGTAAGSPGET